MPGLFIVELDRWLPIARHLCLGNVSGVVSRRRPVRPAKFLPAAASDFCDQRGHSTMA